MKSFPVSCFVLACLLVAASFAHAADFELKDGDRVAFLGDVLIERAQTYGHIESALTAAFPDADVTYRNLGWSGDTPAGIARAGLSLLQAGKEPADEGFKQMMKQLDLVRPTVIFFGYGMASSLDEESTPASFEKEFRRLLEEIGKKEFGKDLRYVFLSPLRHESLGDPWPNPSAHNARLKEYVDVLETLAKETESPFIDLYGELRSGDPLTQDGLHLTEKGYLEAARVVIRELDLPPSPYFLSSKAAQAKALREVVLKKNQLFFHRSRPQNMAYILGFRKHEQGQNAVEIPQFDPLVEKEEVKIALLRKLDANDSFLSRFEEPEPQPVSLQFASTPQEEMEFDIEDGFEVSLYAENPFLAKPIQMNFDEKGRLWVASSAIYPQIKPGQTTSDSIIYIEDTDADGVADQSHVFATGLLIPTAVEPGDGGVYVGQSTELIHFKDTDGDGKADERRIVFSGFGTEDTHHTIHTLRWGLDGKLYFNQSIYIRSHLETPHGMVRLISGGIFRMDPDDLSVGVFAKGWVNTWGHQFDRFGQSFVTDGAGFSGVSYGLPGSMNQAYAGARRILPTISPGRYPKFAGAEVIASEHFPDDWQGDFITCDFRAHRIVRFKIEESGAGYVTKEMPDLLRTANATFRPIDAKLGPDGALYIADWSNPIIQHGEVDFRDPRRDKKHGRIWRITAKGRPLNKVPDFSKLGNRRLLNQLLSKNEFNRKKASRVLTERGEDKVEKPLKKWASELEGDEKKMRALWMYQALEIVNADLLKEVLAAKDGKIRAAGVRVLGDWLDEVKGAEGLLAKAVADEHPRVRLEAVRLLGLVPSARSAELALAVLDKPMDDFLDYAVWLTINELSDQWVAALKSGDWKPEGRDKQLEFGLRAIEPSQASLVLDLLLSGKKIPADGSGPWFDLISKAGAPRDLQRILNQALEDGGFEPAALADGLKALAEAFRLRKIRPEGNLGSVQSLLKHPSDDVKAQAASLVGQWKQGRLVGQLIQLVKDSEGAPASNGLNALRNIGNKQAVAGLKDIAKADPANGKARHAAALLAAVDLDGSVDLIIDVLKAVKNDEAALSLWRGILANKKAGEKLAAVIAGKGLPDSVAKAGMRVAREGGRDEPMLVRMIGPISGMVRSAADLTPEQIKALPAQVLAKGDPARGERIYRRQELACQTCHAIGGAGGMLGPDMTSIGASAPVDYLIESLIDPNAKVKEGYHSVVIETKDDEEYSGIVRRENDNEVVLLNAGNQEVSIAKNNIRNRQNGKSLMPTGLIDMLEDQQRLDLFRFLSELGKSGPYDASQSKVARVFQVYALHSTNQQSGEETAKTGMDYSDRGWQKINTTVVGGLLKEDLEEVAKKWEWRGVIALYAAARFEVSKAGKVNLEIEGPKGASVWIDGKPAGKGSSISRELSAGTHSIVVELDHRTLPEQLRVKSQDVSFLVD